MMLPLQTSVHVYLLQTAESDKSRDTIVWQWFNASNETFKCYQTQTLYLTLHSTKVMRLCCKGQPNVTTKGKLVALAAYRT